MRRVLWAIALIVALSLCGCAAVPAYAPAQSPQATEVLPTAVPSPSVAPDQGAAALYLLSAHVWQDVYDENYILTFDVMSGTMTEENTATKSKTVYRISFDKTELYFWADSGAGRKQFSYTLADGLFSIDYGDPLGVITYAVADK